jgi:hypothetical protein
MDHQHQQLLIRRDLQHAHAPQRPTGQIEVQAVQKIIQRALRIAAIQRDRFNRDPAVRQAGHLQHLLARHTVVFHEAGAQHRMSFKQRVHSSLQRRVIEPATQTHSPWQVPGTAAGLQAIQKPQPLLHR